MVLVLDAGFVGCTRASGKNLMRGDEISSRLCVFYHSNFYGKLGQYVIGNLFEQVIAKCEQWDKKKKIIVES